MSNDRLSKLFYDRLTGKEVSTPEIQDILMGRWVLYPAKDAEVFLNSAPVNKGDYLVPEPSGVWRVLNGCELIEGTVIRKQLPEDLEAESLRTIGGRLKTLVRAGSTWLDWIDVIPLVPGMTDDVELQPLEKDLIEKKQKNYFGHLEAVCKKPRAHLLVESERVPVSKARRISVNAASYLASHTEDWDSRLIRGIMPKRILSEVRYDQIDIYENRVAARLLDHLVVHLTRRIQKLKKLLKIFQEKEDYGSLSTGGTYQRQKRIMALWGDSMDANEGRRKVETTLKELETLKYKIMGLMDSPLYRGVPLRTYVSTTLRTTNILANDQHYRQVAEIWREWGKTGASQIKKPQDLNEEKQQLCQGMNSFAVLLVVRALEGLGYEPHSDDWETAMVQGADIRVEGNGSKLTVCWHEDDTLSIVIGNNRLRILSLAADLKNTSKDEQVQIVLDRICGGANGSTAKLLVLYAASSGDTKSKLSLEMQRNLHTIGNDPRFNVSQTGFLPVSPWEIGSTERVARALRWFLTGTLFNDYPWRFEINSEVQQLFSFYNAPWLSGIKSNGQHYIELYRPALDYEWEQFGAQDVVTQAAAIVTEKEEFHQRVSVDLREAVRAGGAGGLNREKSEAHQAILETKRILGVVKEVSSKLKAIRSNSAFLLQCPICGTVSDAKSDFQSRARGCFRCQCVECKTEWATRFCGSGHKYAVMLPSGKFMDLKNNDPGWEDRAYGGDLLALPARTANGNWGFVCPECGDIS